MFANTGSGMKLPLCASCVPYTLAATPHAVWVRTRNDPVYAPEHLAEQRAFTSVLTVTYRSVG